MLERHDPPSPDTCDVCKYAADHSVDSETEHALTRLATMLLILDLEEAGAPIRLSGLAVETFGVEPGPIHRIDPRHWYWAMVHEPDIQLVLREGTDR